MQLEKSGFFNDALLYRDQASLSGVDERREGRLISSARGRDITISNVALDQTEAMLQKAMQSHSLAKEAHQELRGLLLEIQGGRERLYRNEEFLVALMEGNINRIARDELLANFLTDVL